MIDPSLAFTDAFAGFSMWVAPSGEFQCSIKRKNGAFAIAYGATPEEAWDNAWCNTGKSARATAAAPPIRRRRDVEDLA